MQCESPKKLIFFSNCCSLLAEDLTVNPHTVNKLVFRIISPSTIVEVWDPNAFHLEVAPVKTQIPLNTKPTCRALTPAGSQSLQEGFWRGPSLLLNGHPRCKELPEAKVLKGGRV